MVVNAEELGTQVTKENDPRVCLLYTSFSIGFFALVFAVFTKLGALVGCGVGVFVAVILLIAFNSKSNTPKVFLDDSARMLSMVGPLSMLPMLLASLGAIFTAAGVGQVIAKLVGNVIPAGNMTVGIIVYALAMMIFTMIMGNGLSLIHISMRIRVSM